MPVIRNPRPKPEPARLDPATRFKLAGVYRDASTADLALVFNASEAAIANEAARLRDGRYSRLKAEAS